MCVQYMFECALSRFRTMSWNVGQGIDMAAMDGSQHHHLVNSYNYIRGLTIDAEGQLYRVVTSG